MIMNKKSKTIAVAARKDIVSVAVALSGIVTEVQVLKVIAIEVEALRDNDTEVPVPWGIGSEVLV